jgi:hypothetical protein
MNQSNSDLHNIGTISVLSRPNSIVGVAVEPFAECVQWRLFILLCVWRVPVSEPLFCQDWHLVIYTRLVSITEISETFASASDRGGPVACLHSGFPENAEPNLQLPNITGGIRNELSLLKKSPLRRLRNSSYS